MYDMLYILHTIICIMCLFLPKNYGKKIYKRICSNYKVDSKTHHCTWKTPSGLSLGAEASGSLPKPRLPSARPRPSHCGRRPPDHQRCRRWAPRTAQPQRKPCLEPAEGWPSVWARPSWHPGCPRAYPHCSVYRTRGQESLVSCHFILPVPPLPAHSRASLIPLVPAPPCASTFYSQFNYSSLSDWIDPFPVLASQYIHSPPPSIFHLISPCFSFRILMF